MIVLVAKFYPKEGRGAEVADALKRMEPLVRSLEPGCLMYQAHRSTEEPETFLVYEQYRDEAALAAHRETPHFQELIEGVVLPLVEKRERKLYTPID